MISLTAGAGGHCSEAILTPGEVAFAIQLESQRRDMDAQLAKRFVSVEAVQCPHTSTGFDDVRRATEIQDELRDIGGGLPDGGVSLGGGDAMAGDVAGESPHDSFSALGISIYL